MQNSYESSAIVAVCGRFLDLLDFLRFAVLFPAVIGMVIAGCSDSAEKRADGTKIARYDTAALIELRRMKDVAMGAEDSPLDAARRRSFTGLNYYPPATNLVFHLRLEKILPAERITIAESNGDSRSAFRIGYFSFEIDGKLCRLAAYSFDSTPTTLFVPFADATNGGESYSAGRYIDIAAESVTSEWVTQSVHYYLDFNYAYNPYCAYNDTWVCPRVPKENVLTVAINAGERAPKDVR